MKHQVGTVKALWRYPVKSMDGEQLNIAKIEKSGLVGDRYWAIRDEEKDELSSVRKLPALLQCSAKYLSEPQVDQVGSDIPQVTITLPDGSRFNSNDEDKNSRISDYLKKDVSLWPLQPRSNWQFYRLKTMNGEAALKKQFNVTHALPDMSSISWSKLLELSIFSTPLGHYYDIYPLHIISSNSIEKLKSLDDQSDFDCKRFRANMYIESMDKNAHFDEFDWVGGLLYIGDTIIKCESKTVRCSMPAQPQPGINKDTHILRTLERQTERHLGINATIIKAGTINDGDPVYWVPESKYSMSKFFRPISNKIRNALIQAMLKATDKLGKG